MTDLLFVYGSLLSRIAHPQGERLRREATLISAARLQGRLYRVSWYPGVVRSNATSDQVHGEVYRLHDPVASLRWLDEYEGLTPGRESVAPSDEYARTLCQVELADGATCEALVYIYQRDVASLERVAAGIWSG